jgi:hypothetical protein
VCGVLGDDFAVTALDQAPGVHHQGVLGEVPGGRDVVRDVEDRQVQPLLEVSQQVEDAQPDGDVEHGDRLIGEQHLRVGAQRSGD